MNVQMAFNLRLEFRTGGLPPGVDWFGRIHNRDVLVLAENIGTYAFACDFVSDLRTRQSRECCGFQMQTEYRRGMAAAPGPTVVG